MQLQPRNTWSAIQSAKTCRLYSLQGREMVCESVGVKHVLMINPIVLCARRTHSLEYVVDSNEG